MIHRLTEVNKFFNPPSGHFDTLYWDRFRGIFRPPGLPDDKVSLVRGVMLVPEEEGGQISAELSGELIAHYSGFRVTAYFKGVDTKIANKIDSSDLKVFNFIEDVLHMVKSSYNIGKPKLVISDPRCQNLDSFKPEAWLELMLGQH